MKPVDLAQPHQRHPGLMPQTPTTIAGPRSRAAFAAASAVIPGGVNSPVRAWKRLDGQPIVIASGSGAEITDLDGRTYIDYVLSWGPLILGHAHPQVVRAVAAAARRGLGFGAPTPGETALATRIRDALPSMELVRLVSTGTEAVMSALRVARAATGRELVIKCDGCYHGHADALLVAAGSGCATLNTPDSAGISAAVSAQTLSVPFNDAAAVERQLARHRGRVAAVIVEPVAGNMGLVLPQEGYLAAVRAACTAHGAVLIFDEVMTGFRVGWGGWQTIAGITPDLTCLGKVIGGGLPLAAYGGRRDLMTHVAPLGPCYQAGTLSGNPVAVAAGLATLAICGKSGFYDRQHAACARLVDGLRRLAADARVPMQIAQCGTMWGYFFSDRPVIDWTSAAAADTARWQRFVTAMYHQGINLAPSPFEAAFWSAAHRPGHVRATLAAAAAALRSS
jgi:glutamate-1-semialdehyde 2,1-aminomutase